MEELKSTHQVIAMDGEDKLVLATLDGEETVTISVEDLAQDFAFHELRKLAFTQAKLCLDEKTGKWR